MQLALIACWLFSVTTTHAQEVTEHKEHSHAYYTNLRTAHGIMASLAWVFFFPLGAILLPLLRSPHAFWVHAGVQSSSIALLTASVATGIIVSQKYKVLDQYHPIIGLVLFALVFFQAAGGIIHHLMYKKYPRRTVISHAHIWLGRIMITLGMINGGLGLWWSRNTTRGENIAYGVIAGVIWVILIATSVYGVRKRRRNMNESHQPPVEKRKTGYLIESD